MRIILCLLLFGLLGFRSPDSDAHRSALPAPVLVELFTSEGCSSCPPADALLRQLDASQPVAGAQLIVLSEHVDYWNYIGWKDPFSSAFFSQRQSAYADRFKLESVYTPQMVVDGSIEFVGGDSRLAAQAVEKVRGQQKVAAAISDLMFKGPNLVQAQIRIGPLPEDLRAGMAEVYLAVALNHAESEVLRGENGGRRLQHVAVVQSITKIGTISSTKGFAEMAGARLKTAVDPANLRVVVFVQQPGSGKILGAALQKLGG